MSPFLSEPILAPWTEGESRTFSTVAVTTSFLPLGVVAALDTGAGAGFGAVFGTGVVVAVVGTTAGRVTRQESGIGCPLPM